MTRYTRDGKPAKSNLVKQLEIDAVYLLRNPRRTGAGMRDRLNARAWLLDHGWPVEAINAAAKVDE